MLSSFKKWVQDVAVDLTPPLSEPSPSSSTYFASPPMPGPVHRHSYATKSIRDSQDSPSVYISRPMSMDSVRSSRMTTLLMPPPPTSPVELDLSHLNPDEQEHIANVLKRARAVEEQQSNSLGAPATSEMSPAASVSSSISSSSTSSSSSSTSTSGFTEKIGKNDDEL